MVYSSVVLYSHKCRMLEYFAAEIKFVGIKWEWVEFRGSEVEMGLIWVVCGNGYEP